MDLLRARKVNNYEADATSGTLWTSTTTFEVTVPAGKRWWIFGGVINRTDSDACNVAARNVANAIIARLAGFIAATGLSVWPSALDSLENFQLFPFPLDAGEDILISFGGAQQAGAYASVVAMEVDI